MLRRTPSYSVTTVALVFIAVAAFGVRYAAQFLPERQPNDLKGEYAEYVRRSMRETVDWHPYGPDAFRDATERGKIVFLDVGTVMSLSAKRFSEDYATDGEYRMLLYDHFEPIKIDANEMPWIVDALSLQTPPFLGAERFLAVTTDAHGGIVEVTPIRSQEGSGSLAEWLEGLARLRYANPGEVDRLANLSREARPTLAVGALVRGPCNEDMAVAWARVWQQAAAEGLFEQSRMLVTVLPMEVLGAMRTEGAQIALQNLMLDLAVSPAFDAIDGGFFLTTIDPNWRRPIASKMTGHSLQLAAAFAEVGRRFDAPLFSGIADRTVSWAAARRSGGLFDAGLGTDQTSNESSPYYRLGENDVEALPFWVGPTGFPRIQTVGGFDGNVNERRALQVFEAADSLKTIRSDRPKPRNDGGQYADQNGQAISGLFRIANALQHVEARSLASEAYRASRSAFVQPLGDVLHAPTGRGRTTSYCNSYLWMARAAIDGYLATGSRDYLSDAEMIMHRALELFRGESGALMSYLPSLLTDLSYDLEIYIVDDRELQSANALAALNLADLAAITGKAIYKSDAEGVIRAFSAQFADGVAPAGMVLAALRLYVSPVIPPATP